MQLVRVTADAETIEQDSSVNEGIVCLASIMVDQLYANRKAYPSLWENVILKMHINQLGLKRIDQGKSVLTDALFLNSCRQLIRHIAEASAEGNPEAQNMLDVLGIHKGSYEEIESEIAETLKRKQPENGVSGGAVRVINGEWTKENIAGTAIAAVYANVRAQIAREIEKLEASTDFDEAVIRAAIESCKFTTLELRAFQKREGIQNLAARVVLNLRAKLRQNLAAIVSLKWTHHIQAPAKLGIVR